MKHLSRAHRSLPEANGPRTCLATLKSSTPGAAGGSARERPMSIHVPAASTAEAPANSADSFIAKVSMRTLVKDARAASGAGAAPSAHAATPRFRDSDI